MNQRAIEVLLHTPPSFMAYREVLESFISKINEHIQITDTLSPDTDIVISLISKTLGAEDENYYNNYSKRNIQSIFYYFEDISLDIDDFNEEVFKRIAFKEKVSHEYTIANSFKTIEEINNTLEGYLKESIEDVLNRTNYSKINSSVMGRSKGNKFYDNDNNLKKVDNFLRRGKRVSLINGLGGVGKTTLAIEYAKDALDNEVYDYLIWFDIEKGIDNEIRTFAIKFLLSDLEEGKEALDYYKRVFEKFIENYPNSLIVLDNYAHSPSYQEGLQQFLRQFSSTDIIITSREDISKIAEIKPIELDVFQNLDDALEMFNRNSQRNYSKSEEQSIKEIIHYLGNLPLALEITANFLDDSNMKIEEYLQALKEEGLKLFDKISDYQPKNHLEGLVATLKINAKITDNEESLKLLKAFALLSPEPINRELIETYLVKELDISEFNKTVSLRDLEKFSYIKLSNNNYTMHRLIQESIREEFFTSNQEEQKETLTQISSVIFDWFVDSFNDNKYGKYFNQSAKNIEYILETWEHVISDKAKIYLYTCLSAYVETTIPKPKDILLYIEKAMELEKTTKIEDRKKFIVYKQYGQALELNSRYEDAHKSYNMALEFVEEDSIEMANIYSSIGGVYHSQENYKDALVYYQKDLNITLQTRGENHPDTATTYNNIGLVYGNQKKYKQALDFFQKSLDIKLETIGVNHPDTATTYYNIGLTHKYLKECKRAKESLQKALDIILNLEIDKHILELQRNIKEIEKNIQKEKKLQHNKRGRYCKDA